MVSTEELQDVEVVEEDVDGEQPPFIRVRSLLLRNRYQGQRYSRPYRFDVVEGPFVDAVAVVLYWVDREGKVLVGLRRGIRPSIYLRKNNPKKALLDGKPRLIYQELVAGGIEDGDLESIGIDGRAAVEVREEAGFEVSRESMVSLGEGTFSSPGFGMEKLHYRAARVAPSRGQKPEGDGHPLEEVGDFSFHELSQTIAWCRSGRIQDSKTEIGLYRLANYLGYHPELRLWDYELPEKLRQRRRSLGLDRSGED